MDQTKCVLNRFCCTFYPLSIRDPPHVQDLGLRRPDPHQTPLREPPPLLGLSLSLTPDPYPAGDWTLTKHLSETLHPSWAWA
ncbi:unnamed protein product [Pleuronectes platessa]|uniref:Uncharacterized protein n=1 Tax=Pleuronectes platessa TaxID=8262 RepID=A0A9N7TIY3_PLEPL|nr:unnamed protein product [Pleuronectes platessa]